MAGNIELWLRLGTESLKSNQERIRAITTWYMYRHLCKENTSELWRRAVIFGVLFTNVFSEYFDDNEFGTKDQSVRLETNLV